MTIAPGPPFFYRFHVVSRGATSHHRFSRSSSSLRGRSLCSVGSGIWRPSSFSKRFQRCCCFLFFSWDTFGGLYGRFWWIIPGEVARVQDDPVNVSSKRPISQSEDTPIVAGNTLQQYWFNISPIFCRLVNTKYAKSTHTTYIVL